MKHILVFLFLLIIVPSSAQYKNKSAGFIENKGQIIDQKGKANPAVKFLLNSNGLNVQLRKNGFSYDIYEVKKTTALPLQTSKKTTYRIPEKEKKEPEYNFEYVFHRVDIDFVNSNSNVEFIKEQESKDFDNYYNIPNNPKGILGVHSFKQITYKNIYPNIDVVFTIPSDSLKTVEYNFIVHPKGKISDIQLKFNGAKTELIDNKIRMSVRFGEMDETLPASWTEDKTGKKDIAIGYKKIKNNVYGFESNEEFSDKKLIIDPVPIRLWGTFYGDQRNIYFTLKPSDISTDTFGNAYVSGSSSSLNPSYATAGAHQSSPSSAYLNGIIEKFSPDGNRLWGTYYGGQNYTDIKGVKIDSQNNVIITGTTESPFSISTAGSYKPNLSGSSDAFLAKFNSAGVRIWATYFGGEYQDLGHDIDIDDNDNIFLIGLTTSTTGIAINSNFQTNLNIDPSGSNTIDGYLAKFGDSGNLIWSTYVGGENRDDLNDIVVKNNYLIIGGTTRSFSNISTPGVFQEFHNTITHPDGVIYKFSLNGERIWATYYGGEQIDEIYAVQVDDEDNIYLGGQTASNFNMTTVGSFESTNSFSYKGFFAKLNKNGHRLWGTFLGQAHVYSIIYKNNSIFISGTNFGFDYPKLTNLCSYRYNKHFERYIAKFTKEADLIWGTYIGGGSSYSPMKIALDNNKGIFASGISSVNNGIADLDSYQSNVLGIENYFLMKFLEPSIYDIPTVESNSPICIGNELKLIASGGTNYLWTGPNGFTSTLQNPTIPNATALNSGQYSCSITGTGGCDDTKKVDVIIGDIEAPIPNLATLPVISGDCNTTITTFPTATDTCAGTIIATTTSPLSYNLPGTYTVVWKYDDGNGNSINQNQTVTITSQPSPIATSPQTFCIQQNATLSAVIISGQNIKWYDSQTNGTLLLNTTILQNGTTYYASQTINSCESESVPVLINIVNTASPTGNSPQTFCSSQNPTLATIILSGTAIRWYDNATNGLLLPTTTPLQNGITYYASQTENGCESTTRLAVTIELINTLPASNYEELLCDDLNDGTETVNLNNYESNIISSNPTYTLSYYSTIASAENELSANKITNTSSYRLNLGANIIYVRINSNTPCYAITTLKLTVVAKPIIPIADIVPICANNTISINAGAPTDSFLWSTGATTPSISIVNPGEYAVTVTRNYGPISCLSSKKFSVKKSTIATITSIETLDWTDKNNMITIYVSGAGDYEYSIDGIHYQSNNQFQNLISGAYTAYVKDKNGCGIVTDKVYLLMYPKFFTPNGDGYNDTWSIHFSDTEVGLSVKLFDRYGKLITVLNKNQTWDGTFNGHELPSTDYWFTVTRADGKIYKGHFTLKR
tara:strand:+ start:828 stop:4883 length:4056 start_codon:yes stop_codon:yes gene_type:complete